MQRYVLREYAAITIFRYSAGFSAAEMLNPVGSVTDQKSRAAL